MRRQEILSRLSFTVPESKKKRVIISSDVKNEADDPFAIVQHLLTPGFEVKGIIATHFEWLARSLPAMSAAFADKPDGGDATQSIQALYSMVAPRGVSMQRSYEEAEKILKLTGIDDVPLFTGSSHEIGDIDHLPPSDGADFIIQEALREDEKPLFVCLLGALTDLAIALKKEPKIAERLTAVWIGGGDYPDGGDEFNLKQDIRAAQMVFGSAVPLWQIPRGVYKTMEISLAELIYKIKPCGQIGAYLCEQMLALNNKFGNLPRKSDFPHGESWSLGDNPTVSVLLQCAQRECWHTEAAPIIQEDGSYTANPSGKPVRVYDSVDTRLTIDDLCAKLWLCYR